MYAYVKTTKSQEEKDMEKLRNVLINQKLPHFVMRVHYHCGRDREICYKHYDFMMERYNEYINLELVSFITVSYFNGEYYSEIPLHAAS